MLIKVDEDVDVLIPKEEIGTRVRELAEKIAEEGPTEDLLLVAVLKGSTYFLVDLSRALPFPHEIDFLSVKSYEGAETSGIVQLRKDLDTNIEGRNVLLVEDIVDTGLTLAHLRELLETRKPKSLKVVSFLSKPAARKTPVPIEFVGKEIPNVFVVGYGLDYNEKLRHLPYIGVLK